jgi:hypothetical protein
LIETQGKGCSSSNVTPTNGNLEVACVPEEFGGLIFVRYLDHVLFNRLPAWAMKPQVREAVGWLVYECEYYLTLTWDRDAEPHTLKGGDPKASGIVLLKSDIQELKKLEPLQNNCCCHLNSAGAITYSEYALQNSEAKNSKRKKEKIK